MRDTSRLTIKGAAERRPDVAEADPEKASKVCPGAVATPTDQGPCSQRSQINVDVSGHLASLAQQRGFTLFYISTDYVFNGKK